ncbi:MAG: hypothetical protein ABIW76_17760 [Fibrobacteria bacterium]
MLNSTVNKIYIRIAILAWMIGSTVATVAASLPETVHPGLKVVDLRPDDTFQPMVTGLGFLSDGRLVVAHWGGFHDSLEKLQTGGKVYIMTGVTGDNPAPAYTTFAQSLEDPAGMLVKDDKVYVTGGEKLIELSDEDKDGKADPAKIIATIPGTHARHEFLFGLVFKDGKFWMNPSTALDNNNLSPLLQNNPNRGTILAVDPSTGTFEVFATGLRMPNGIGIGPEDELFVPDVQGSLVPANKLINIRERRFYGYEPDSAKRSDNQKEYPPVVYLPQMDVAQAPGNPLLIRQGDLSGDRFVGQMLLGDAVNGGIRRIFVEKVNGEWQGSVFSFTGGLEAGANRLIWGPDGYLYVGMCGQGPGWSYKQDFGLQKLKPNGTDVLEMVAVRSRAGGLEIQFTHEPNAAALSAASYSVKSWYYRPTVSFGGSPIDMKYVTVGVPMLSPDKKSVFLPLSPLDGPAGGNGRVYNIKLTGISAVSGLSLWTRETWYTLNNIDTSGPFESKPTLLTTRMAHNEGFRLQAKPGRLELAAKLGAIITSAQVRDPRGALVAEVAGASGSSLEIPTANWASGIYIVTLRDGTGASFRRQVAIP